MRTLAGRLGVRASSLYRHFADRSAIEKALAIRTSDQLLERMRQAIQGQNGERALFAAARAYLDFAIAEPAFYDMMMQYVASTPESSDSTKRMWDFFLRVTSDTTNFRDDAAGAASLWSFMHGFIVLLRSGQLGESSIKLTFARGTQALVRGLSVADAEAARSPL